MKILFSTSVFRMILSSHFHVHHNQWRCRTVEGTIIFFILHLVPRLTPARSASHCRISIIFNRSFSLLWNTWTFPPSSGSSSMLLASLPMWTIYVTNMCFRSNCPISPLYFDSGWQGRVFHFSPVRLDKITIVGYRLINRRTFYFKNPGRGDSIVMTFFLILL